MFKEHSLINRRRSLKFRTILMNVIGQIHSNRSTDSLLYFVVGHFKFTIKLHDIRHSCPYEEEAQAVTALLLTHNLSPCTFVTQCRNVQIATQTELIPCARLALKYDVCISRFKISDMITSRCVFWSFLGQPHISVLWVKTQSNSTTVTDEQ